MNSTCHVPRAMVFNGDALLDGPPQASYTYLGSFLFSSHNKAQNIWLFHVFILGILGPMAVFMIPAEKASREVLLVLLRLFPQFCLSFALIYLGFTNAAGDGDDDDSYDGSFDPFDKEIRNSLIFMGCEAVGYFLLVLFLERCDTLCRPCGTRFVVCGDWARVLGHSVLGSKRCCCWVTGPPHLLDYGGGSMFVVAPPFCDQGSFAHFSVKPRRFRCPMVMLSVRLLSSLTRSFLPVGRLREARACRARPAKPPSAPALFCTPSPRSSLAKAKCWTRMSQESPRGFFRGAGMAMP